MVRLVSLVRLVRLVGLVQMERLVGMVKIVRLERLVRLGQTLHHQPAKMVFSTVPSNSD